VSIAVTFILVFIVVKLIGNLVEKVIESVDLSFLNRLFGVLFSMAKMALILGVLLVYLHRLDQKMHFLPEDTRENSIFYKPLTNIVTSIFPSLDSIRQPDADGEQV
jgi:membrane protein required for colicin V production